MTITPELLNFVGGCVTSGAACFIVTRLIDAMLKRAQLRLKTEQIKDRVFRDACDTIHHLRVENDALTTMVMAMAEQRSK